MTITRQSIIWGYACEILLALLVTSSMLILDRNGMLPRPCVFAWVGGVYKIIAEYLLAGVFSWVGILSIPFLLIAFAGEDIKRRILEQESFTVHYHAYAVTTIVLIFTYFLSPTLMKIETVNHYGLFVFFWSYSAVLLITAAINVSVFLRLVQAMSRLEREIRRGKYDSK